MCVNNSLAALGHATADFPGIISISQGYLLLQASYLGNRQGLSCHPELSRCFQSLSQTTPDGQHVRCVLSGAGFSEETKAASGRPGGQ